MPEFFPENNTALKTDTEVRSLQKIVGAIEDLSNPFSSSNVIGSFPTDAFGRLKVSNPFTLFDSSHRYRDNGLWSTYLSATGASATFNASQGLMDLTINAVSGSEVIRETTKVFAYQPGKSLLVMSTFVMNPAKDHLEQKVGYYGDENGMYLELSGSILKFVKRSFITGAVVETQAVQSDWNGDKLDGTGPSGLTLDITKAQILWMDFEWLGVGTVRMGFVINGQLILCHSFHHANLITSTYITTASLPLRYEIRNVETPSPATSSTLKQICSTVISEGGYQLNGAQQAIGTPIGTSRTLTLAGTFYPIVSLKLKTSPDRLDAITILTALSILPDSDGAFNWQVRSRAVTQGGSWLSASDDSSVQYNITGTGVDPATPGRILASGFFSKTNQSSGQVDILKEALFKFQLERDGILGIPYELTLVVASNGGSDKVFASLDWEEISR
jgi:hypothetical protein